MTVTSQSNNDKNNQKTTSKNNKQDLEVNEKKNHVDVIPPPLVFLDLTQTHIEEQEGEENLQHERLFTSTHDLAELMLYSFVDNSPHVADLLWSKQLLDQEDFLTLTDEQEWSEVPFIDFSTHEPLLC